MNRQRLREERRRLPRRGVPEQRDLRRRRWQLHVRLCAAVHGTPLPGRVRRLFQRALPERSQLHHHQTPAEFLLRMSSRSVDIIIIAMIIRAIISFTNRKLTILDKFLPWNQNFEVKKPKCWHFCLFLRFWPILTFKKDLLKIKTCETLSITNQNVLLKVLTIVKNPWSKFEGLVLTDFIGWRRQVTKDCTARTTSTSAFRSSARTGSSASIWSTATSAAVPEDSKVPSAWTTSTSASTIPAATEDPASTASAITLVTVLRGLLVSY